MILHSVIEKRALCRTMSGLNNGRVMISIFYKKLITEAKIKNLGPSSKQLLRVHTVILVSRNLNLSYKP